MVAVKTDLKSCAVDVTGWPARFSAVAGSGPPPGMETAGCVSAGWEGETEGGSRRISMQERLQLQRREPFVVQEAPVQTQTQM